MADDSHPRLPPNQQLIRGERWPVVGEGHARTNDDRPWSVTLATPTAHHVWTLAEVQAFPHRQLTGDIHCVTRWSKYDMTFSGVWLRDLLDDEASRPLFEGTPGALADRFPYINFVARSDRNHATSLRLDEALRLQAFLAWGVDGGPLPAAHGGPLRVVVLGKYFYKSLKWLERIELMPEDSLGYWEADAGYHNDADPWQEQRYLAPALSKQEAARLIESRDFSQRDLRGIVASDRDLRGLRAHDARLRNGDFRRAQLQDSQFDRANLSNARFQNANLRGASFRDADVDGADFSGADLRGADLRVASMFGTTFVQLDHEGHVVAQALRDRQTQYLPDGLSGLAPEQQVWFADRPPIPSSQPRGQT